LRNLVKQYILFNGNGEAAEILDDFVTYADKLGYVVRRVSNPRRRHKLRK
jgi:hypothetical protein